MKRTKIIVSYHQPEKVFRNEVFMPIQVGKEASKYDLGFPGDNTGENISEKNIFYCELTGVYWAWKNLKDADYIGLCHYRRCFTVRNVSFSWLAMRRLKNVYDRLESVVHPHPMGWEEQLKVPEEEYQYLVDEFSNHIDTIWNQGYDIIAPKGLHFYPFNTKDFFEKMLGLELMRRISGVIKEETPKYYEDYQRTLRETKCFYYANLEVMKSELFDEYCTFLFTVFDGLEIRLHELFVDPPHEKILYRKFGYLGEILTSTFISKAKREGIKVKECTVVFNATAKGEKNRKK